MLHQQRGTVKHERKYEETVKCDGKFAAILKSYTEYEAAGKYDTKFEITVMCDTNNMQL